MRTKIAPSILSADFSAMGQAVKMVEEAGADLIHVDVMDGSFVEPITFGAQMVKNIRPLTKLPLDCHLMIEHPKTQIKFFADAGADIITVHYQPCNRISPEYLGETLAMIKSFGVKCGAVVNPDIPIEVLFPYFKDVDMVLIMSVFPGYGGQKFIPECLDKVKKAREYANSLGLYGLDIEIDGGVTEENAKTISGAGANVLVAGSAVFRSKDPAATIANLKR